MARRQADARREEILRATVDELTRRGIAETRVADVAATLDVSPALVFYHFETKERLLAEAFAYAAREQLRSLKRALDRGRSAADTLLRIVRIYAPLGPAPTWRLWIDAWAASLRMPEMRRVSQRLDVHWKDAVVSAIDSGVRSGEFRCDDPDAAAWRITAMMDGLAIQNVVHRGLVTRRQMRQWVLRQAALELGLDPAVLLTAR
jgi:AcrR family transcriptional regulator